MTALGRRASSVSQRASAWSGSGALASASSRSGSSASNAARASAPRKLRIVSRHCAARSAKRSRTCGIDRSARAGAGARSLVAEQAVVALGDLAAQRAQLGDQRRAVGQAVEPRDAVERGRVGGQRMGLPVVDHLQPVLDRAQPVVGLAEHLRRPRRR